MSHGHHHHEDHHGHDHSHGHGHAPASFGTAFAIGIALNVMFVAVEAAFGFLSNSMALLADAGHNLSDVLGLAAAWAAHAAGARAPTPRFTYGWKSGSILAALFNAVLLLVAVGAIAWEAVQRLMVPEAVASATIIWVAGLGIVINAITARLFARGRKHDLNIRGAYLHMMADALVSIGVVAAGFAMLKTGWAWIDPVVSLIIAGVIFWSSWSLLRESFHLSLDAVPAHIDPAIIRKELAKLEGVAGVHDLHIWPISTTDIAMTAHLVMPAGHPGDSFYRHVAEDLRHHHRISHVTLQIETDADGVCELAPDHVV